METKKVNLILLERFIMKNFIILIFLAIILQSAYAQQQFKAKDGISASTKAAADGGLKSPELVLIATSSEQIEGFPVSISFDMSKGTANAWLYLYRSAVDVDSLKLFAVTKILNTYIPLQIPISNPGNQFPFRKDTTLNNATWFDSDIMAQKIRDNSTFQEFSSNNKDYKLMLAYISINPLPEPAELTNKAIWGIIFNSTGGRLSCLVNGETGDVFCQQFPTTVNSEELNSIRLLNNPVSDILYIRIPVECQNESSQFLIYNSNGSLIKKFNNLNPGTSDLIYLPVNNLESGVYFLTFNNSKQTFNIPFIVLK
jgi:hypothetical protein